MWFHPFEIVFKCSCCWGVIHDLTFGAKSFVFYTVFTLTCNLINVAFTTWGDNNQRISTMLRSTVLYSNIFICTALWYSQEWLMWTYKKTTYFPYSQYCQYFRHHKRKRNYGMIQLLPNPRIQHEQKSHKSLRTPQTTRISCQPRQVLSTCHAYVSNADINQY